VIFHTGVRLVRLVRTGLLALAAVASTACRTPDQTAQPRFTVADFSRLRWLAGDWQSKTPGGRSFYDRYRVIDDSTMQQATFSDSTFRMSKDSAVIGLRGGLVIDRANGAPWLATRIDSSGVTFQSQAAAANRFVWTRVSPDHWTTELFLTDPAGGATRTLYQVERVKRK